MEQGSSRSTLPDALRAQVLRNAKLLSIDLMPIQ
jgi:hypothetical protein